MNLEKLPTPEEEVAAKTVDITTDAAPKRRGDRRIPATSKTFAYSQMSQSLAARKFSTGFASARRLHTAISCSD